MLKYEDRVIQTSMNNYLRMLGNMASQEVDLDKMRAGGEQLRIKLDALVEEESQRGNDDLRVFPDLLDLNVLADKNRFTTGIKEVLSMSLALSDNASALVALGFNNPGTFADFNVASAQISQIPKRVAFKLYHNLVNAIKTESEADDLVIDIVLAAIEDQIQERMNFPRFCDKFGIAITEENEDKIRMAYNERYEEWVSTEAERILEEVITKPMENVIIDPTGVEELREVLYEICPAEANEWISNLDSDVAYSGEVFEKLMNEFHLPKESLQKYAVAVEKFMKENQTPEEMQLGRGQMVNPFYSLNLAAIILHTMIMASADVWSSSDEMAESTEYVVDMFREELTELTTIEYDPDATPYRLLSVISFVNDLMVSRCALTRASSQDYIYAQGAITMMINRELLELSHKEAVQEINN